MGDPFTTPLHDPFTVQILRICFHQRHFLRRQSILILTVSAHQRSGFLTIIHLSLMRFPWKGSNGSLQTRRIRISWLVVRFHSRQE